MLANPGDDFKADVAALSTPGADAAPNSEDLSTTALQDNQDILDSIKNQDALTHRRQVQDRHK